jgi:hypothetical protein
MFTNLRGSASNKEGASGYLSQSTRFDSQQRSLPLPQRPDGIMARPVPYQMHTPAVGKSVGALSVYIMYI